jgi:porin
MGLATVSGQEPNYPILDVPLWLKDYGYEDGYYYRRAETQDSREQPGEGRDGQATDADPAATDQRGPGFDGDRADCFLRRDRLTGDWGGRRSNLQENGIIYRGRLTQFFFGLSGGVPAPAPPPAQAIGITPGDKFAYTGNSRHDFLFDLEKFGGPRHGRFVLTLENLWGEFANVGTGTGATTPTIFSSIMPVDREASGIPYVTNFLFAQPLSEKLILSVGKTRLVSVVDNNIFAGGDGSEQFLNQAFNGNPLFVPQLPLSTFAVTAVSPQEWGNVAVSVLDPIDRGTGFMDFGSLFEDGMVMFGQIQINTMFFGKPGQHHVGGFYKNVDLLDLNFLPTQPVYPEPPAPPGSPKFQTRPESYTLFYGFDQYVSVFGPKNPRGVAPGWGFFGRAGLADDGTGNPNFNAWHLSGGIGGDSPLSSRRGTGDRFGIGYGYTGTSTEWGAIPQAVLGPRDAQVVEVYYRYHLTPSIHLTPDLQYVRGIFGELTNGRDAFVFGLRMNMRL